MTAIITDINEYRTNKQMASALGAVYYSDWTDERLKTRYELLLSIEENGIEAMGNPEHQMYRLTFPAGYNPEIHPEDNLDMIFEEGQRRGVFPSSA